MCLFSVLHLPSKRSLLLNVAYFVICVKERVGTEDQKEKWDEQYRM
jgi:hypothetical protein